MINIIFFISLQTAFRLNRIFKNKSNPENKKYKYLNSLRVPKANNRGVAFFVNRALRTADINVERKDEWDKFNHRVWLVGTKNLFPKADGTYHELFSTYGCSLGNHEVDYVIIVFELNFYQV